MEPECLSVQEVEQLQFHEIIEDGRVGAISCRRLAVSGICE
jgi:hypothetical protein